MKNAGLSAVMSFFIPGLGQIYNGNIGIGIFFMFTFLVGIITIPLGFGAIIMFVIWVWAMTNAYNIAEAKNRKKEYEERQKWQK